MDDNVQLAAYHPDTNAQAFPAPDPSRVNPQPTDKPAQQLQDAVRGLFFLPKQQPQTPQK